MDTLEVGGHLRQVPLFSRLSDARLGHVAAMVQTETYPRGSRLATAGQPGRAFHYILSGEALVRVVHARGRLRPAGYLRVGSYFGVTSLFLGEPHDATIEAKTDVAALVLYRTDFQRLLRQYPEMEEQLLMPEEVATKRGHERFDWLVPGEVVVFLGHRHWYALARSLALPTLLLLVLGALAGSALGARALGWWAVTFAILLLAYAIAFIWYWVDWRNDYLAVTTQRVLHRELILYLYEARYEAPLSQVQDVTVKRGRLGKILGFGDAIIQTAAKSGIGAIVFDRMPNPEEAKQAVFQQTYRGQARTKEAEHETVQSELKRRLQWATPEELAAQGQARGPLEPPPAEQTAAPAGRRAGVRVIPPIREQVDGSVIWRKHWIFLVYRVLLWFLATLALLLLFVAYLLGRLPVLPPGNVGIILGALTLLAITIFGLWYQLTDWGNDVYIVTDDRLIDIEKRPVLGPEERRETTLDRVQNVNLVIPGALATLLNYGNVDIDTAAGEGQFTFTHVMAPHEVQREIMRRVNQYRARRQEIADQQRHSEMADWFAVYERLRQERQTPPDEAAPEGTP